eukprot:12159053-Alexandrium_andersonii.AAC.1
MLWRCRGRQLRWKHGRGPHARPRVWPGRGAGGPSREDQFAGLARAAVPRRLRVEARHVLGASWSRRGRSSRMGRWGRAPCP